MQLTPHSTMSGGGGEETGHLARAASPLRLPKDLQ